MGDPLFLSSSVMLDKTPFYHEQNHESSTNWHGLRAIGYGEICDARALVRRRDQRDVVEAARHPGNNPCAAPRPQAKEPLSVCVVPVMRRAEFDRAAGALAQLVIAESRLGHLVL